MSPSLGLTLAGHLVRMTPKWFQPHDHDAVGSSIPLRPILRSAQILHFHPSCGLKFLHAQFPKPKAVMLLSGGLDSATTLADRDRLLATSRG